MVVPLWSSMTAGARAVDGLRGATPHATGDCGEPAPRRQGQVGADPKAPAALARAPAATAAGEDRGRGLEHPHGLAVVDEPGGLRPEVGGQRGVERQREEVVVHRLGQIRQVATPELRGE